MAATYLEFATPKTSTTEVRLFKAGSQNHFKNNQIATPEQLQTAFNNGLPDLEPGCHSNMLNIRNKQEWLKPCLLANDSEDDFEVVLLMEELLNLDKPNGGRWLKAAVRNKKTNCYHFRSITNKYYDHITSKYWNRPSKNENWWICLSTIGTDIQFFNSLREVLDY